MAKFQKSFYLVLIVLFYTVETGLRPVSTQSTTDTKPNNDTTVRNGLKPFHSTTKSRIAFLVGINSYKATTSLKYAVGDSEAIEDLLLRTGKYDKLIKLNDYGKITTILNPETLSYTSQRIKMAPTKANIEATYQEVLAENPDTLLFYYSGHGFIEGEGGENFIAPKDVDVRFEKKKVGKEIKEVAVPLNGISLKVMGVQAAKVKRVVFLIDACRSPLPEAEGESADKGEKALSANSQKEKEENFISKEIQLKQNVNFIKTEKLPKRVLEAEGITMLIGAAPEVSSLEDEDFKSGIFTHFLKKAFNGGVQEENQEEYITEENLSRFIEDKFKHYYELRKKESETATEPKLYNLTFDRGKKGEILISQHRPIEGKERIDKPIYTDKIRKREVKGKLVNNEKGEREDLRFFVHDKKRDLYYPDSLDGVYKMEYAFTKDKSGELENFTATEFNLENEEVFEYGTKLIPNVGWEYRGLYNASDTATDRMDYDGSVNHHRDDHRRDLINQVPTMSSQSADKEKIRFERKIFDFNGNVISEEYFDANGKPLEFRGVSKVVRAFDKYGQVVLEEFYSKEILDEYGDVAEKGELVAKDGFARYKAKYKSKGNLLLETWEDTDGKIVDNHLGYAKTKYVYDKNERLIRKKFYDKENKPANDKWGVSSYSYSYNSDCIRLYESKLAEVTKKINKTALTDWKLGKYKLCLAEEIHTDKEGKPAGDEKQVYKISRAFDKKGCLVSEESFRADGRRYVENGVAKIEYSQDNQGNIISRKNFGEFEVNKKPVPVSDGNGVHEYRYNYFDLYADGTSIFNECIFYRKEKGILLEPYDCALKIEHFGIDGKPIKDMNGVYRTNIYYTGQYQKEAERYYYSNDNQFIHSDNGITYTSNPYGSMTLGVYFLKSFPADRTEYKYDERNNILLKNTFEILEGKEVIKAKEEFKYDERNNKILEASYEMKEMLELITKKEYKYDEKNNQIQRKEYETQEGKEVLIKKEEYKYDEKSNRSLKEEYGTIDGKQVLLFKEVYKYDEKNNKIFEALFEIQDDKETLLLKYDFKYDERNNKTLKVQYKIKEGKEILYDKEENKFDERNNNILSAYYIIREGKEILIRKNESKYDSKNNKIYLDYYEAEQRKVRKWRYEWRYDEKNNNTLHAYYETKEGKEALVWKYEYKYDERNNIILKTKFETKEEKEVLVLKEEYKYKYDDRNNKTLYEKYETKDGKEILSVKNEYQYDKKNKRILEATYGTREGKVILLSKKENEYDSRNNKLLNAYYEMKDGIEVLNWKDKYQYDEKNNLILNSRYELKDGKESLVRKTEYRYDEKNNNIYFVKYIGDYEKVEEKNILDFRSESYQSAVKLYDPQILDIVNKLNQTEVESEKKSLNQKLEDLEKEFEAKKKKYTLTEEKFGPNEKLESASYKLLFFNPRGPADKRLMRVDLDRFYRPVKVGFEEE